VGKEGLTQKQVDRQDFVDNVIHGMLCRLAGEPDLAWNIEHIGTIRDAARDIICGDLALKTEMEFYPYIELEQVEGAPDKKAYMKTSGMTCLYCGSYQIEGGGVEVDDNAAIQGVKCLDCGRSWSDVYRLVDVREEKIGE